MRYIDIRDLGISPQSMSEHHVFNALQPAFTHQGADLYVGRLLQRAAFLSPQTTAIIARNGSIIYKELYARATAFTQTLRSKGVGPQDIIVLLWENSIEFYVAYFAILQAGAVVAPLNVFLTHREIVHIAHDARPRFMIVSPDFFQNLQEIADQLPPFLTLKDFYEKQPTASDANLDFDITDRDSHDMSVLLYTSGTTGFPKGVMTSSHNIMTNIMQGIARLQLGLNKNEERVFGILPLFHSFAQCACVWAPFAALATVIMVPKIERRYLLEGLKHKPTLFLGVPALFGLLALLRRAPIESVKLFISGGDALPDKIRMGFELIYGRKICSGYGLSETTPLVSIHLDDDLAPTATVGRLVPGMEAQVRDDNDVVLKQGEIGTLWVKGGNVMLGYYQAPEATQAVLKDGWFNTGDAVYIDEQHRIIITGRLKDVIAHKGIKIYPQEIENVILNHPLVIRVAVIGREDKATGQIPVAYVQIRSDSATIVSELHALCVKSLAAYKVPREFICSVEELGLTATGKIDKKKLR